MKNTSVQENRFQQTSARQAAGRKRSPTREGMRLSGDRTKKCTLLLKRNHKQSSPTKSIAVTSSNSLLWTMLHIKYNMGSKREDPKCCKPRIKYTIWINAFQKILGIEKIGNQENLICLCSSSFFLSKETRYWLLQALGGTQLHIYIYIYLHGMIEGRSTDHYRQTVSQPPTRRL